MNTGLTQASAEYTPSQAEEEWVQEIEEAGHNLEAIRAYRDNVGEQYTPLDKWEEWIDEFEESYQGEMSTEDFATQMADEMGVDDLPAPFHLYFDYDKWERDLFCGDYWESNGFIFRSM